MRQLDPVAPADAEAGRGPLADAVERQDGGLVIRAGKEGAGGVALVVIEEDERRLWLAAKSLRDAARQEEFLPERDRNRLAETAQAARREGEVRFQQALKLHQRLVVERDMIDLGGSQSDFLETVGGGASREAGVVL